MNINSTVFAIKDIDNASKTILAYGDGTYLGEYPLINAAKEVTWNKRFPVIELKLTGFYVFAGFNCKLFGTKEELLAPYEELGYTILQVPVEEPTVIPYFESPILPEKEPLITPMRMTIVKGKEMKQEDNPKFLYVRSKNGRVTVAGIIEETDTPGQFKVKLGLSKRAKNDVLLTKRGKVIARSRAMKKNVIATVIMTPVRQRFQPKDNSPRRLETPLVALHREFQAKFRDFAEECAVKNISKIERFESTDVVTPKTIRKVYEWNN